MILVLVIVGAGGTGTYIVGRAGMNPLIPIGIAVLCLGAALSYILPKSAPPRTSPVRATKTTTGVPAVGGYGLGAAVNITGRDTDITPASINGQKLSGQYYDAIVIGGEPDGEPSSVTFSLGGKYTTFTALVGTLDNTGTPTSCTADTITATADGTQIWSQAFGYGQGQYYHLPVGGVQNLTVTIEWGPYPSDDTVGDCTVAIGNVMAT